MSGGILSGGYYPGGYCPGGYCPDTMSYASFCIPKITIHFVAPVGRVSLLEGTSEALPGPILD